MRPVPPLAFFLEHTSPPAAAAPHASSAHPAACEREHSVRTYAPNARETQLHVWERSARVPQCEREREREGAQRGWTCVVWLHAPPWETTPSGAGASGVVHACPRVRAHGEHCLSQRTETRWNNKTYVCKYMYNHCNICNIQIKHLQHTSEIGETFRTYICIIGV
jgi:hypothetical protein